MDREFLKRLLDTVTVSGNEEAGQALALAHIGFAPDLILRLHVLDLYIH